MAITKYKVIKKNLEAVINYAKNGEKTEQGILVSGINCLPENAYEEMMLIKKIFHKEDGRLGYHFIQSFKGKEVSAEECNDIGMELAQSLWGDKFQVLICTHIDKDNVHNHIILNSVSFKTILKARINILNEDIERINKKIQTCRRIISKSEKGEKEEWLIQKRF